MIKAIQKQPLFLLLLPVFFVVHGMLENFGFIPFPDAAALCLIYLVAAILLAAIFYLFFRSVTKAALMTSLCMGIFFAFGTLQDFLHQHITNRSFTRYSILLPAILLLLIIAFWRIRKTKNALHRLTGFLNLLLIIYLLVDIGWIVVKTISPDKEKFSVYAFEEKNQYKPCDTCSKPDIYFLLFDEYASSASLWERYQYNNDLDQFLTAKGFTIQPQSRSNYNFTPFSMASILNMAYLKGIQDPSAISAEDYARCNELIRHNQVIKFLDIQGYDIVNYSIFDLAGHPSQVSQSFLPLKTKLITDRTLFARINRDIGWLLSQYFPFSLFTHFNILTDRNNNNLFIDLTGRAAASKRKRPAFIYTHLYMPHPLFYYDKDGRERNTDTLYRELAAPVAYHTYLDYVTYTNTRIKELVTTLQRANPAAVIMIMGDHGFRKDGLQLTSPYFFTNFNAVYLPGKTIVPPTSGVNQFRVVFNELFHQSIPLLKDSCIFLQDKQPSHP
ncbi:hypothetical protein D3H65_17705 [Paraflavitalea soli]|uniref:Sulfatase N-terminal domain-containing protein n=1 Tax=Paraflavitalea soli TaxID=2315862 RepID=A0A3B7MML7_9BACT|nr:sulfatase-like hydrolase/transferase [Paraflavitalea soli]AXY75702.1 hypothetical protein D3H65_17705 [Paraflavitalea soli]